MNSANKRGQAARGKKNARVSKGDPLPEFAQRAASVKEVPGLERKPEVVRDSIQAAGSRLGLRIMMADELEAMEGPVSEDAELLRVKPRDRSSEEELDKARRRLDFDSMTGSPDAFKGRFGQPGRSERREQSAEAAELFGGRKIARKLDFGSGEEKPESQEGVRGALEFGVKIGLVTGNPMGQVQTGDVGELLATGGESRKERWRKKGGGEEATTTAMGGGEWSPFSGGKRSSGPDVELKSSRERIMLAENLELDGPEMDIRTENQSGLRTELEEARLIGQGEAPEIWPPDLEELTEQDVLDGLQGRPMGSRHVSHLRAIVDEDGGSERATTPREHYVMSTDSSQGSGSGEDSEEEEREKVVEHGGAVMGVMNGSEIAGRDFAQRERFAPSSGFPEATQRKEMRGERKMDVTSLAPDSSKELGRSEQIRIQPSDELSNKDGHSTKTREPAFQSSIAASLGDQFVATERIATRPLSGSEERTPYLSFSAGGQRIMLASDLLDQLDDAALLDEADSRPSEGSKMQRHQAGLEKAEGFPTRRSSFEVTEEAAFETVGRGMAGDRGLIGGPSESVSDRVSKGYCDRDSEQVSEWDERESGRVSERVDESYEFISRRVSDTDEQVSGRVSERVDELFSNPVSKWDGRVSGRVSEPQVEPQASQHYEEDFEEIVDDLEDVVDSETPSVKRVLEDLVLKPAVDPRRSALWVSSSAARPASLGETNQGLGADNGLLQRNVAASNHRESTGRAGQGGAEREEAVEEKKVLATKSIAVQVGTLNNKGTQVEFDETRGLLWEGSGSLGVLSEPVGLLGKARALVGAEQSARALVGAEESAHAFVSVERGAPPRWEERTPATWLNLRGGYWDRPFKHRNTEFGTGMHSAMYLSAKSDEVGEAELGTCVKLLITNR
jgi:hypothetical protein